METKNEKPTTLNSLNGILQLGLIVWVISNWHNIPDKIPSHFGYDGTPDTWGSKMGIVIFLAIGVGLNLLLYGIMAVMPKLRKNPWYMYLAGKNRILSLPPDKQIPYWNRVNDLIAVLCLFLNAIWITITIGTVKVADKTISKLPSAILFAICGGMVIVSISYSVYLSILSKKMAAQHDISS